jgi:hypothetical protein
MVDEGLLAPRTSLNAPLAGARRLAWVRARLDEVRAAGRGAEASVNDVVLTAVAGGLRSLFLERGERLPPDLVLKALVPVSLHCADEHGTLGNRVSSIYAPLPVGTGTRRPGSPPWPARCAGSSLGRRPTPWGWSSTPSTCYLPAPPG